MSIAELYTTANQVSKIYANPHFIALRGEMWIHKTSVSSSLLKSCIKRVR